VRIVFEGQAEQWLRERGGQVTVDPPGPGGGWAAPRRARVALRAPWPHEADRYHRHSLNGLEIYLHSNLVLVSEAITIRLVGWWKLKWLDVSGLAPLAACSFSAAW